MIRSFTSSWMILLALSSSLGGCLNQLEKKPLLGGNSTSTRAEGSTRTEGSVSLSPDLPSLTIASVTFVKHEGETALQVQFPSSGSSTPGAPPSYGIEDYCVGGNRVCHCYFQWNEVNTTTPGSAALSENIARTFPRSTYTEILLTQAERTGAVLCQLPSVFEREVGSNDPVRVSIVPANSTQAQFKTTSFEFRKSIVSADSSNSSFSDSQGNFFQDIWRYTCHERIERGASVSNVVSQATFTPPANLDAQYSFPANFSLASQFCVTKLDGTSNCTPQGKAISAQLNYFSLYTPFHRQIINHENLAYSCPNVQAGNGIRSDGEIASKFPLDSTFALAKARSKQFNVGIETLSHLTSESKWDSNSHQFCEQKAGENSPSAGSNSMAISCMGFAASPRADGTCSSVVVNGVARPMYRLRRFNALYPPVYDSDGQWIKNYRHSIGQVYVLDRPATFAGGVSGTIYGPKPCPFSWYDRKGVTGSVGYKSTNDPAWKGRNPDGIRFPTSATGGSCPAVIPYNAATSASSPPQIRLGTLSTSDQNGVAMIRPLQNAWEPIYLEDTEFKACAPESSAPLRAPVHHFALNGKAAYCEEVYPTSHRGRSTRSGHLSGDIPIDTTSEIAGSDPDQFPLLADVAGIERALQKFDFFGCQASYAPGTSLTGVGFPATGTCCKTAPNSGSSHGGVNQCTPPR